MKPKYKKYKNTKVKIDGITFDSIAEGERYKVLRLMEASGEIRELKIHEPFVLIGSVVINGRKIPSVKYVADFTYLDGSGKLVIEDVKGYLTPMYRLKRHMMKYLLSLDIIEIH